jgi:hypothetical protein
MPGRWGETTRSQYEWAEKRLRTFNVAKTSDVFYEKKK